MSECLWRSNTFCTLWSNFMKLVLKVLQLILSFPGSPTVPTYEGISKSFRTESITKHTLTTIKLVQKQHKGLWLQNSLDRLKKIAIQLHLVAESCTICSFRSRRPVRKLLDTPSHAGSVLLPSKFPSHINTTRYRMLFKDYATNSEVT
jgi:hypothetical protein